MPRIDRNMWTCYHIQLHLNQIFFQSRTLTHSHSLHTSIYSHYHNLSSLHILQHLPVNVLTWCERPARYSRQTTSPQHLWAKHNSLGAPSNHTQRKSRIYASCLWWRATANTCAQGTKQRPKEMQWHSNNRSVQHHQRNVKACVARHQCCADCAENYSAGQRWMF